MRQNPAKAAAQADRFADGLGPAYRHLLTFETFQDLRYRPLGRPRLLLAALERRETVTVPWWRVPSELRPSGRLVTVTPGM